MEELKELTEAEWREKAAVLFGSDSSKWRFKCPSCGHVTSVEEWKKAGARPGEVAYSCVGRRMEKPHAAFQMGKGPCNYAGGGLFAINPQPVKFQDGQVTRVFAFDELPPPTQDQGKEQE